ncbi:CYTH domain-containing protein [Pseudemcibacter aquimaris]|uniref:CYTH domain-containing protein n=1 Tax=Pseudemcibacter aquimaris TaxID=2857064 RepID=UPI0020123663|nr:CYTH domain-containing protein [Pseudemcibacter aquimaris]MCC3860284.1 CYTH domain-containing protein [Pseudemcibacter aquimaris]WDU57609.1 CYTH domain-containing protein [Pseudemcibacter aquimaris]
MAIELEIERKFLITKRPPYPPDEIFNIRQGYVARDSGNTVRIREKNGKFILNIKTPRLDHGGRHELEYEIPADEGEHLFDSIAHDPILKTREIYEIDGLKWELDIFEGENSGLMVAEVELQSADQDINIPDWIGPDVTQYGNFYNATIAYHPFKDWGVTYAALLEQLRE